MNLMDTLKSISTPDEWEDKSPVSTANTEVVFNTVGGQYDLVILSVYLVEGKINVDIGEA